jgi:hypothetical protein
VEVSTKGNNWMTSKFGLFTVVTVLAVCSSGCEGHSETYKPVDANGQQLRQWTNKIDQVRFYFLDIIRIKTQRFVFPELVVDNFSEKDVVVLGGGVWDNGEIVSATLAERKSSTVLAGESKTVRLDCILDEQAGRLFGQNITWVWMVRIGDTEHVLKIPMTRTR